MEFKLINNHLRSLLVVVWLFWLWKRKREPKPCTAASWMNHVPFSSTAPTGGFRLQCVAEFPGAYRWLSSEEPLLGHVQIPLGLHLQMDQRLLDGSHWSSFLPQVRHDRQHFLHVLFRLESKHINIRCCTKPTPSHPPASRVFVPAPNTLYRR